VAKKKENSTSLKFGILDNVPTGICVLRNDFTIIFWNTCLAEWSGISETEMIGEKITAHFPELAAPPLIARLEKIFLGEPSVVFSSQQHPHLIPCPLGNGSYRIQRTIVTSIPENGEGYYAMITVEDVTELAIRNRSYKEMRNQALEEIKQRKLTEEELMASNQRLIKQQKSVIEEERLKVLLQMAGATAHELNQPLMALVGNIELMEIDKSDPEKLSVHMSRIEEAGKRISNIVKRIQNIRSDQTQTYLKTSSIVNLDQRITVLSVEGSDSDFSEINHIIKNQGLIRLHRATDMRTAMEMLREKHYDLIFLDYKLTDGTGLDFLKQLSKDKIETPVVVITGHGDEMIASQIIKAGAYDYLNKTHVSSQSLSRAILNTL